MESPSPVDLSEIVGRYIRNETDIMRATGKPKPAAFFPNHKVDNKTSVFRISSLDPSQIWDIGAKFVEAKWRDGKKIIGRSDVVVARILGSGLRVISSPHEHPLHADIDGWPPPDDRESRLLYAQRLALFASVVVPRPQNQSTTDQ